MKWNNKIVVLLMGLFIIFSLSACEGNGDEGAYSEYNLLEEGTVSSDEEETTNIAPVANAGNDQNVLLGNYVYSGGGKIIAAVDSTVEASVTVELDGSASSDDGLISPLTYTWKLLNSGTGVKPQLDNNMTVKPTFTLTCETAFEDISNCTNNEQYDTICNYVYELTVFDGELSAQDTVTVTSTYDRSCFPE